MVAGVDEVGRGAWAGPLTVAAVVAEPGKQIYKVRDSKMLRPGEREKLHDRIIGWASAVCVAHATVEECMELGMSAAQRLVAGRALAGLGVPVDHVLVDGPWDFVTADPAGGNSVGGPPAAGAVRSPSPAVTTVVKGDRRSLSIAAASVVAKVTRDRMMTAASDTHPAYRFASNKGYPCPRHIAALAEFGPSMLHRRTWAFMDALQKPGIPRVGSMAAHDTTPTGDHTAEADGQAQGQGRLFASSRGKQ